MRHIATVLLITSATGYLPGAVPLRWTVETSRVQPASFEAYQGETLTFEAALQSNGKPLEAPLNYSFFWQTNGMGNTYWEKKVVVGSRSRTEEDSNSSVNLNLQPQPTNVLFATWSPEMDVGAKVYNCFIGSPSNIYHAAFQLRLRPSPGATPNALPLPTPVIDFASVRVLNPPWSTGGGGCDTNAVDALANSAVVTNALTVATTNRVALLESSKADRPALPVTAGNLASLTADGNLTDSGKTVGDFLPRVSDGPVDSSLFMDMDGYIRLKRYGFIYGSFDNIREDSGSPISLRTELDSKADRSMISATNTTFSSAVLAVGLNIDTNSVAVLNEIAETFGGFPLGAGETATTVGGLLAALAAAVAWLKRNKVQTLKLNDNSVETSADGGVAKLDNFFTESNSLLNGRLAYSRNATGLKDRAFNTLSFDGTEYNLSTALAAVTPTASGQPRDLLIVATATAATTISFTAGTIKGDKPTIDGAGTWLITLTEYEANTWYCRQIKMEDAA